MPVYVKRSGLESGLIGLAAMGERVLQAEQEIRRRGEEDRKFGLDVARFEEQSRQYNQSFAESVRQFDNQFNEGIRQFDDSMEQGQQQFEARIAHEESEGRLGRASAERQTQARVAAQNFATRKNFEARMADNAIQLQTNAQYLNRLEGLAPEGTTRTNTYATRSDGSQLSGAEMLESVQAALAAGDGLIEDSRLQAQLSAVGVQPLIAYAGSSDGQASALSGYRHHLQTVATHLQNGGLAGALSHTFQQGIANETVFSLEEGQSMPTIQTQRNEAFNQRLEEMAVFSEYGGDRAAWNALPDEQREAAVDKVYAHFQRSPTMRRELRMEQVEQAHQTARAEATGALAASSVDFQAAFNAGSITSTTAGGQPAILSENIPDMNVRRTVEVNFGRMERAFLNALDTRNRTAYSPEGEATRLQMEHFYQMEINSAAQDLNSALAGTANAEEGTRMAQYYLASLQGQQVTWEPLFPGRQ